MPRAGAAASWSAIAGFAVDCDRRDGAAGGGRRRRPRLAPGRAVDGWPPRSTTPGPAWLTRERLRGLQQVAVAHFAERYGLFVLICLGESVVAHRRGGRLRGTPAHRRARPRRRARPAAPPSACGGRYFDRFADGRPARLRDHDDPVLAAADAYSYIHLLIVAGIIIFAGGVKLVVHNSAAGADADHRGGSRYVAAWRCTCSGWRRSGCG